MAWIINYILHKSTDVITYPCQCCNPQLYTQRDLRITLKLWYIRNIHLRQDTDYIIKPWHQNGVCRAWISNYIPQNTVGGIQSLTHWGRVTHICVGNLTIIGSDNGLSPGRRQAITWTNAGLLLIGPLRTNFSEILIGIQTFSFRKMDLKMSSAKWRPFVSASMQSTV